jgi:hypothetical protein
MCDECTSTWFADDIITTENWIDTEAYIKNLYPEIVFKNDLETYSYIEELNHETILEDIDHFGGFPKEASHFFIYYSNAFFIAECNINEACLVDFLIEYNFPSISTIVPYIPKSHKRIIRYNFRFFCDNESPDIVQCSHIVTRGLNQFQFFHRSSGLRFRHVTYDSYKKKMYWYQIVGVKENRFFVEASILHNIFYPDYKV